MDQTAQDQLRSRLKLRRLQAENSLKEKHPHVKRFFDSVGLDLGKIRQHSARLLTAGTLGSALLLSTPHFAAYGASNTFAALPASDLAILDPQKWLIGQLALLLPTVHPAMKLPFLGYQEEKMAATVIEKATGVPARASLEGERLNVVYGFIGAEQHLARFPGDNYSQHELRAEGMAPGLGAWGYFTEGGKLTTAAILREKYYVAVQTLYLPDWNKRFKYLRDWYKWRKVVVVNPDNGKAVVAVIGDSGPAAWTGKQFGGSPEVMNELGGLKYKKGRVVLLFVDDPANKIKLGPIDYSEPPEMLKIEQTVKGYPALVGEKGTI